MSCIYTHSHFWQRVILESHYVSVILPTSKVSTQLTPLHTMTHQEWWTRMGYMLIPLLLFHKYTCVCVVHPKGSSQTLKPVGLLDCGLLFTSRYDLDFFKMCLELPLHVCHGISVQVLHQQVLLSLQLYEVTIHLQLAHALCSCADLNNSW